MGLIFKDFENKWIKKGREQEYRRMTEHFEEQARKQGIEYTPPPPKRTEKD